MSRLQPLLGTLRRGLRLPADWRERLKIHAPDALAWRLLLLTFLFTVDYAIRLYASSNRLTYPFGFFPVVDLLTCVPVYVELGLGTGVAGLSFFRFARVLRVLRVLRSEWRHGTWNRWMPPGTALSAEANNRPGFRLQPSRLSMPR